MAALLDKNNNSDGGGSGGSSDTGRRRGLSVRIKLEPEYQTDNSSGEETMQKVPSMSDLLEENSLGECLCADGVRARGVDGGSDRLSAAGLAPFLAPVARRRLRQRRRQQG